MRYWIILSEFSSFGGGIATYAREITAALRQNGHEVTVFIPGEPDQAEVRGSIQPDGTNVVQIALSSGDKLDHALSWWQLFSYRTCAHVVELIERGERPDVIEVQDYGAPGYYLLKHRLLYPGPLRQIPVVMFCHSPVFEIAVANESPAYRFPTYGIGRTEKFCLMAVDKVICPSYFLAKRLSRFRSDDIPVIRLPYQMPEAIGSASNQTSPYELLYLGAAQYIKGVLHLLEGIDLLWAEGATARLRIVGADTLWPSRETYIKDHIRGRYALALKKGLLVLDDEIGWHELATTYQSARVAIVPSLFDNFPYTCIEAMAHGVPVLGSREGGHAELLSAARQDNHLFDIYNPKDIARLINRTLSCSAEQLRSAGAVGRKAVAELCDPAQIVAKREELFSTIARPSNSTRSYPFVNDIERIEREGIPLSSISIQQGQNEPGLLTVVIPYFNLDETIDETIASVMASDYRLIEVVIVDDGSTGVQAIETLRRIENTSYPFQLRVERIAHGGLANARNVGAKLARGDFLAFLDADDIVLPSFYSKAIGVLASFNNVSYVYSWAEYFEGSSGCLITFDTDLPYLLGANMICAAMLVIRTKDYLAFGMNSSSMKYGMEDYEAWIGLAAAGKLGVSLPELLLRYRRRPGSMSMQFTPATISWLYERIPMLNPEIFREWGDELAQLSYANGPGRLWNDFTVNHGEVGFAEGGAGYNFRVLSTSFSQREQKELAALLNDATARRVVRAVLATRIHVPVLAAVRFCARLVPHLKKRI